MVTKRKEHVLPAPSSACSIGDVIAIQSCKPVENGGKCFKYTQHLKMARSYTDPQTGLVYTCASDWLTSYIMNKHVIVSFYFNRVSCCVSGRHSMALVALPDEKFDTADGVSTTEQPTETNRIQSDTCFAEHRTAEHTLHCLWLFQYACQPSKSGGFVGGCCVLQVPSGKTRQTASTQTPTESWVWIWASQSGANGWSCLEWFFCYKWKLNSLTVCLILAETPAARLMLFEQLENSWSFGDASWPYWVMDGWKDKGKGL